MIGFVNDLHYQNLQHDLKCVAADIRVLLNSWCDVSDQLDKDLNAAIISENRAQEDVVRAKIALVDKFIEDMSDIYEDRFAGKN